MPLVVDELPVIIDAIGCQKPIEKMSVTAELAPTSKKTILKDRLFSSKKNSRSMKLLRTSEVDLTGNEKDFLPYWNKSVAALSEKLWLPIGIDFADLDLSLLPGYVNKTLVNSWFSTTVKKHPIESLSKTSQQLLQCSLAGCMEEESIVRSKKIRLQVNRQQKQILLTWCGASRYFYNQAVEKNVSSWRGEISVTQVNTPEWAKETPYQIKKIAVKDYVDAKRICFKRNIPFHMAFRSKKLQKDSLFIPKQAVKLNGIYIESLKPVKFREKLGEINYDCRLIHENGKFYLSVPFDKPVSENQAKGLVAVDPGVRNFLAFYTPELSGKLAPLAINRIHAYVLTWIS